MKERASYIRCSWVTGLVLATVLTLTGVAVADVVTSNLNITPTPCKRGDVLHFSATIYNNPVIPTAPGTAYYCAVVLDVTNPELSPWHSELKTFDYPAQGKTFTINFTSTYTVPKNLKAESICFYVTEGSEMKNKISYKNCIKVTTPLQIQPKALEKKSK